MEAIFLSDSRPWILIMALAEIVKAYEVLKFHGYEVDSLAFRRDGVDLKQYQKFQNNGKGSQKRDA